MTTNNPYKAPTSNVASADTATYDPKIFSFTGRIGRLRYLAYLFVSYLILIPVAIVVAVIGGVTGGSDPSGFGGPVVLVLFGIAYIAFIVYVFALAKRRFNDLDKSGWMVLLMFIPLVNFIVGLYLLIAGGKPTANRFGPAPSPNPAWVKVCGIIGIVLGVISIIGVIAAVALPAYSDYSERAQQYESQLP